ncbi:MAG: alpha-2-macroglobulin family protein, partial [Bacteroidales bacterium]|nr:alpha-2-macroglobulin family protein [Bacteroidales bacterium]
MKKFNVFLVITAIAVLSLGFILRSENKNEFKAEWKQVERLVDKGLPKSALKIVDSIYFEAKKNNNTPQVLKSLIYRVSLQSQYEEDHLVNAINTFEQELQSASTPEKQILQSMLAEMYSWYYQQNRWKINDMTSVVGLEEKDIRKWDAVRLNTQIREYYLASLKDTEKLEGLDIDAFSAILNVEEKDLEAYVLWPTLYDLLANRAIEYFSTQDAQLAKIGDTHSLSQNYLVPVKDFVNIEFKENDDLIELRLYQRLLAFHLKENNTVALVDLDLKRLQYVYSLLTQDASNQERYIDILSELGNTYRSEPQFVEISYELALIYFQNGNTYKPGTGDQYKWDLNKADSICREAIQAFPDTTKSNACQNLINEINQVHFDLQLSNVELPGKPFLGYLSFKNTTRLYFKIVEVAPDQYREQNLTYREKNQLLKYLNNPVIHKWSVDLPDTKDHQSHTTEIRIPELGKGFYMVFVSDKDDFKNADDLQYNTIWISNLSYLTNSELESGTFELYVLDREKGTPVSEVNVTTYRTEYEGRDREYTIKKIRTYQTDKLGYLKIDEPFDSRNSSFMFSLQKEDDRLFSEGRYHLAYNRSIDKYRTQTYFFTDRAIYRPGQTVYFKGIVIAKNGNEVKIKTGYKTDVILKNANYKEVSTIEKTTNEFGSFQGAFVIPQGGLNGRMTIKCETGSVSFLVEEYKRPTFQVQFDTIKDTYKLGDEISVTGHAETYTGNAVNNASVKYRVVQQVLEMPYYRYYMYFPRSVEKEIANGIITTDEEGMFVISFETVSERLNNQTFEPNYQFKIHVDVTDVTGEVQSEETRVNVGRISKILSIHSAEKIQKEKTDGMEVYARNLAGAEIDIETTVKLYRLTPSEKLYVERYWNKPDLYLIPEPEFVKEFPMHVYKNENQKSTWKREKIYAGKLTIHGKERILKDKLSSLEPGVYYIAIEDVSDTLIKAEKYITLYSTTSAKIPENEIFWSAITDYSAEPGETIQLVVGSADKKTKILYELVNGDELIERNWLTISRGQKVIDIPVKESYRGGFRVNISTIKYNRAFDRSFIISVPFTNKKLDITLETHRDFLTPGQKEAWKVKISGPDGEKVTAELLAGMYDTSLDQFQPNTWNLDLYHAKRSSSTWRAGQFRAGNSNTLISNKPDYLNVKNKMYPAINWFGYQQGYGMGIYRTNGLRQKQGIPTASGEMSMDGEISLEEEEISGEKAQLIDKDQELNGFEATGVANESGMFKAKEIQIPLRTNFSETAFFYPQMQTDSSGSVILSFTTPDALTEWKLLMLSHTKDLKTGAFVEHIKAKKDLMVIPNVPRFVRQGDHLAFTAKVINYTDEQQQVDVHLELFDPISMKVLDIFEDCE